MVSRAIDAYARRFAAEGVMMHLLGERGGAQMLIVWRPRLVAKLLESASNRDFLTRRALPATGADALMRALAERMIACYARRRGGCRERGRDRVRRRRRRLLGRRGRRI